MNDLPYPATRFERFIIGRKPWLIIISFLAVFGVSFLAQVYEGRQGHRQMNKPTGVQAAHRIGLALFAYASDHDGKYPQGKSSTEVFQKLLDGDYLGDPGLLYFPMNGKVAASENAKTLKPENVCWDVTDGLATTDAGELPLVFWTGYKIDYVSNGVAHPLANAAVPEGIAVYYVNNSAKFAFDHSGQKIYGVGEYHGPEGIFVFEPTFDPKGKTYRQLTPDGPLP